jgi:hypothetical protein
VKRPWRHYPQPPRPATTEGRQARERAERALEDARRRKAESELLRGWFRGEVLENHFGRDVEVIFDSRRRA